MTTSWYGIEPRAPLVFRTAKPFGAGSRDGANFPWPSSLAGLLRTQVMDDRGWHAGLDDDKQEALRALPVAGPLLARREDGVLTPWVPRPADALMLFDESDRSKRYHRLRPAHLPDGCGCDLPEGMLPLRLEGGHKGKPQSGPAWWPLASALAWGRGQSVSVDADETTPWLVEHRTHVAIDSRTLTTRQGALFQTEGLDLGRRRSGSAYSPHDWVLLANGPSGITPRMVTLGGERRLSWLAPLAAPPLPAPAELANTLAQGFALTLMTPALFGQGWRPAWLDERLEGDVPGIDGLRVRLRAAAVERWQSISGWDLAKRKPKAARKAVAAGSTYWFEILTGELRALEALWMTALSDELQDRRDGFGLALPRPWNSRTLESPESC